MSHGQNCEDHGDEASNLHAQVRGIAQEVMERCHHTLRDRVRDDHLSSDPAEEASAEPDDDREAVHELHDALCAEDDDRDREDDPGDRVGIAVCAGALCSTSDCQDVVQAHHEVSDEDGLHSTPDMGCSFDLVFVVTFLQERVADVEQVCPGDQLDPFQIHEEPGEDEQDGAKDHRTRGTEQDCSATQVGREGRAGKGDHDGVIHAKHDVDADDLDDRGPVESIPEFHDASLGDLV